MTAIIPATIIRLKRIIIQDRNVKALKQNFFFVVLFVVFLLHSPFTLAGKPDSLFLSDELLVIDLRTDFGAILRNRTNDAEYRQGEIRYYYNGKKADWIPVRVSPRGNFRLRPENCSFPPLLLNFRKEDVKNTLFEKQDKLKLVTPCQKEKEVIEEYIIYKMYNAVTGLSLKTRLALIRYYDTAADTLMFVKYSFFIEDKDRAAERLEAKVTEENVTPFDIDYDNFKKLSFFQYLIGNKDWHVSIRKNVLIMQPDDKSKKPFAVPYDFDFSGLVNAEYSNPKGVRPDNPRERRLFKGLCYTEEEIRKLGEFYRELKPGFRLLIRKALLVPSEEKYEMLNFLDESYAVFRSRYLIKEEIYKNCDKEEYYKNSGER